MPDCPLESDLRNWMLGNLPDDVADQITDHIDLCPKCEDSLTTLERQDDLHDAIPTDRGFHSEEQCHELLEKLEALPLQLVGDEETVVPPEAFLDDPDPEAFGRYIVESVLGQGGFGKIFLARDAELNRKVAIKVPHRHRISDEADMQVYLEEARTLAQLDHPHVVPIHDVGRLPDGRCYFVSKYIDGHDLWEEVQSHRYSIRAAIELIATISDALNYVHEIGIVHRDIKPKNILLDVHGTPFLTDFGLAIQYENAERSDFLIGTPHYMSPEQARGEGHLVDGRSDIFSLGVVLYLLLTGERPFDGSDITQTLKNVAKLEPKPLRQINPAIPRELERACLRALSKRASDRYANAKIFAEDLRYLLPEEGTHLAPHLESTNLIPGISDYESLEQYVGVVPKGLRSFDKRDANFFLNLLPGPRDRDGYPESIRLWKEWIESADESETSRVGVIYGPSGCGKSSLVKAGVLPLLDQSILKVVIECTPTGTEQRLLRALREACPFLKPNRSLSESLADIRLERELPNGTKVLLVLDQFEQWLHGTVDPEASDLALALRQCDGEHTQTLLQVRDDFWLVLSRLMSVVEIPLIQGQNMSLVDLFDPIHARKVLVQFGQAFGRLPIPPQSLSLLQDQFLDEVIEDLTVDEKVFPVRIALFAEMLKGRPWTPETLQQLGGIQGIGTIFLEEAFTAAHAPVNQKIHEQAARDVLRTLLPDQGTDIKVCQRRTDELKAASSYRDSPEQFEQLLRILEVDLKLISPTEAPEAGSLLQQIASSESQRIPVSDLEVETSNNAQKVGDQGTYYQLSHDYLIPSLREWLTRRQMQTYRGRLELQFEDRVSLWAARPYKRNLPTWWEWSQFRLFLSAKRWGQVEKKMMSTSTRTYSAWTAVTCVLAAVLFWGALVFRQGVETNAIIEQIPSAELAQIPGIVSELNSQQDADDPQWVALLDRFEGDRKRELAIRLALLPSNVSQVEPVIILSTLAGPDGEFNVSGREYSVISKSLNHHPKEVIKQLWDALQKSVHTPAEKLRVAILLAPLMSEEKTGDEKIADEMRWEPYIDLLVDQLQKEDLKNPAFVDEIIPAFSSIAPLLAKPMQDVLGVKVASVTDFRKTRLLSEIVREQPELLCEAVVQASKWQIPIFLGKVEKEKANALPILRKIAAEEPLRTPLYDHDDVYPRRRAMAIALLFKWGENIDLTKYLERSETPALRSFLIHHLAAVGVDPNVGVDPQMLVSLLRHKELSPGVRSALLQTLGNYYDNGSDIPAVGLELAEEFLITDPDAGVHSAAKWLLKQSGMENPDEIIHSTARAINDSKGWYIAPDNATYARIDASDVPGIKRVFDMSTTEVTLKEYERYRQDSNYDVDTTPYPECPINVMTWYESIHYCRWLSEQAGIPEEEQCYPPEHVIRSVIEKQGIWDIDSAHLLKTGYRLPTSEEWEYACRAGTKTDRFCGNSDRLLAEYARFGLEKGWMGISTQWENHTWPVGSLKPNENGLFDIFGNVQEWCIDANGERFEKRIMRGGGFGSYSYRLDANVIENSSPSEEWKVFGFRVVRTVAD